MHAAYDQYACGAVIGEALQKIVPVKNPPFYFIEGVAINDLGIVDEPYVYEAGENEYIGRARSKGGDFVVKCKIVDGVIEDISILQTNDTPRWCDRAIALMPQRIIDAQSTDVEIVTGATRTSLAFINSVADALAQASE